MSVQERPSVASQNVFGHARSHFEYSGQLFETGLFSDCIITCQHRTWNLHRAVLAPRCAFFKACFSNHFQESYPSDGSGNVVVSMHEDDPDALDRMLRWLYTLEFPSQVDEIPHRTKILQTEADQTDTDQSYGTGFDSNICSKVNSGSTLETSQTPASTTQAPLRFWTRELSLFVVADKYNLTDLAAQVTTSIEEAVHLYSHVDSLKPDCKTPLSQFDDFIDMLEVLYTDLPSTLSNVRQLQRILICRSAMLLAVHANQQTKIFNLMMAVPVLSADLVEALRQIAEAHADKNNHNLFGHDPAATAGSVTSSRSSSTGNAYASSSESRLGSQNHTARRSKPYIPMNEDSDTD